MTIYRRGPTEIWEELAAAAAGALAGAAAFYLVRLWLQREPLPGHEAADRVTEPDRGAGSGGSSGGSGGSSSGSGGSSSGSGGSSGGSGTGREARERGAGSP